MLLWHSALWPLVCYGWQSGTVDVGGCNVYCATLVVSLILLASYSMMIGNYL